MGLEFGVRVRVRVRVRVGAHRLAITEVFLRQHL